MRLDGFSMRLPHKGLSEGEVDVVIRPESVLLTDWSEQGVLQATVVTATYMGAHAEYNLDTPVGRLFAIAPEAQGLRTPGERVGVRLAARGVFAVRGG